MTLPVTTATHAPTPPPTPLAVAHTSPPTTDPSPSLVARRNVAPLAGVLLLTVLLVAWEVGVRVAGTPVWIVPAPSDVGSALVAGAGELAGAAAVTLGEALAGLVLGTATGLALAITITFFRQLEQAVLSIALLAKSTPIIAVAPILTIWLGFGHGPKVVVTALLTFFPMLINALEGFHAVDPAIEDWFDSIDASPTTVFRHARWPSSWPYLFAALKVSAPLAMIGAVVAEWMGASSGLGRAMWLAYSNLRMPELFAAVMVLTVLSALVYALVSRAERHVLVDRRR